MHDSALERKLHEVRVQTTDGPIEGSLLIVGGGRILDELNTSSRRFLTIHGAKTAADSPVECLPLQVNKNAIRFVRELAAPLPQPATQYDALRRTPVRLTLGGFEIEGFVTTPGGGNPFKRLENDPRDFVALTSVLLRSPNDTETVPFLAVNFRLVTTARVTEIASAERPPESEVATAET